MVYKDNDGLESCSQHICEVKNKLRNDPTFFKEKNVYNTVNLEYCQLINASFLLTIKKQKKCSQLSHNEPQIVGYIMISEMLK